MLIVFARLRRPGSATGLPSDDTDIRAHSVAEETDG